MKVRTADLASFDEKASAWKTDAGTYRFMICSSANKIETECPVAVNSYKKKVNNVMKPQVKLNRLHR